MEIGTCFQEGCHMKNIHYHCTFEKCNFIFEVNKDCCPRFETHVHCRLCEDTDVHAHCNRCQRTLGDMFYDSNVKCEYCDLGGNCDKCGILIPDIKKQTRHDFCNQCNICVDTYAHRHCITCNVITGFFGQHYHCRWCNNLKMHSHIKTSNSDGPIQTCGIEGCTKMYDHLHCKECDWCIKYGQPYEFHTHCSKCNRTDSHRH